MSSFPIDKKLVIGIASSALFDLSLSHQVYEEKGIEAYRQYQINNKNTPLAKGIAFSFIQRFLKLNQVLDLGLNQNPVEVVLLSRNSPETGLRIFSSIQHYQLDITRAAFTSGQSPYAYIPAFNVCLFLSANQLDVQQAIAAHYPAGLVLPTHQIQEDQKPNKKKEQQQLIKNDDDANSHQLRIAFDFDGVIADDESEAIYKKNHDLKEFEAHEVAHQSIPHNPGPLADLCQKLSIIQAIEKNKQLLDKNYKPMLQINIITARNAPSHERIVTTLQKLGISVDQLFLLGGMQKSRIIEILKPHIFFDDQKIHLQPLLNIPMVHIPFGVANSHY
jgi:5'-nucleotidase